MVFRSLVYLTLSFGCWSSVHARPVPVLTYAELFEQADCVLIVHPISTRDARQGDPLVETPREVGRTYLTPVVTRFKVLSVVKGEIASKEILVPHYRLDWDKAKSNGIFGIGNGPSLVIFANPKKDDHDFAAGIHDPYCSESLLDGVNKVAVH